MVCNARTSHQLVLCLITWGQWYHEYRLVRELTVRKPLHRSRPMHSAKHMKQRCRAGRVYIKKDNEQQCSSLRVKRTVTRIDGDPPSKQSAWNLRPYYYRSTRTQLLCPRSVTKASELSTDDDSVANIANAPARTMKD